MTKSRSVKHKRSEYVDEQSSPAKRTKSTPEVKESHIVGQEASDDGEFCPPSTETKSPSVVSDDNRDLFQIVSSLKSDIEHQGHGIEEILTLQRGRRPKFDEIAAQWSLEKEELEQRLEEKQKELDECVTELNLFHDRSLKCEDSKWNPEDDQSIACAVQELHSRIRTWARRYSVESFEDLFPPKQPKEEFHHQQEFFRQVLLITSFKDFQSLKEMEHPFLIFAALLSAFILATIFEDPFFHWRNPREMMGKYTFRVMARKMYNEMLAGQFLHRDFKRLGADGYAGDVTKAVSFRVNILRHDFPEACCPHTNRGDPDELLFPKSTSESAMKSIYNYLGRRFLDYDRPVFWISKNLKENETVEMNEGLNQILRRAGNLHLRLMTRRTQFEWIRPKTVVGKSFKVRDPALEADRVNDILDEKDETWNGENIQMVVGIGLMARGDAFGNDYSKRRIIAPSRVCLQNDWS